MAPTSVRVTVFPMVSVVPPVMAPPPVPMVFITCCSSIRERAARSLVAHEGVYGVAARELRTGPGATNPDVAADVRRDGGAAESRPDIRGAAAQAAPDHLVAANREVSTIVTRHRERTCIPVQRPLPQVPSQVGVTPPPIAFRRS